MYVSDSQTGRRVLGRKETILEAFQTWPTWLSEDVKSLRRGHLVIGFVIVMETIV